MMQSFRKNPNYLANYHTVYGLALFVVNCALFAWMQPDWKSLWPYLPALILFSSARIESVIAGTLLAAGISVFREDFQPLILGTVPLAFVCALAFSGLIHCASHGSLRPRWFNRPFGEAMAFLQLSRFPDWKIIHVMHHAHTDDPERDPHPPMNKGYWDFTRTMRMSIAKAYLKNYFEIFGETPQTKASVRRFALMSMFGNMNKIFFFFMILKPQLFSFFFMTSIVFKMLQFSLLNWAAHRPSAGGGYEVRNLEHGFFKLMNFFSFGLYVHKNHHLVPTLFNPKTLTEKTPTEPAEAA